MLEKINHKIAPREVISALISLYNRGELDKILKNYIDLTKIYCDTPEIHIIFGNIYYKLNKFEKSVNYFIKGINLDPYNPNNHSDLGLVLFKIGKYEDAIKSFKKAIKLNKNFYQAYDNLGKINHFLKRTDDSISYYKKSLIINPRNKYAILQIGKILFETDNHFKALTYFKKYFDIDPRCPEIITYITTILYKIGEYHLAFNYVEEGLKHNPNSERLINLYGAGLHTVGKYKLSIKHFQKSLEIEKTNPTALVNLIQLSGYYKKLNCSKLINHFIEINKNKLQTKSNQEIVCLLGFGRSGSLFMHSLIDGHPEIQTLPGYFLKGWFGQDCWSNVFPVEKNNWEKKLVNNICDLFEPQFNALSKKNVIGEPNGTTKWLARGKGFTSLGETSSIAMVLDQNKFKSEFLKLIKKYKTIDSKTCFEIIHKAFDIAYRQNLSAKNNLKKVIFYHLHNPNYYELTNFAYNYPSAKFLYVVRDPIQMLESWITDYMNKINQTSDSFQKKIWFNLIVKRISRVFHYMYNPFNNLFETKGIKLEDLKRNYEELKPKINNWIGIDYHPALEKSEFLNLKFSRPSASINMISGFDTRSIDTKNGRFFSPRDIQILETLLWPFMKLYGYTNVTEKDFHQNLNKIKPYINEPLDIEINYFSNFKNKNTNIKETSSFKLLHQSLLNAWNTLDQNMSYPYLIKKL